MHRIRRVVTATDESGKSYLLSDGIAANAKEMTGMAGLFLTDLWETAGPRASNRGTADAAARPVHLEPPDPAPSCASSNFRPTRIGAASATCQTRSPRSAPAMRRSKATAIR